MRTASAMRSGWMPRIDTTMFALNRPAGRHAIDVLYIGTLRPARMWRTGMPVSISGNSNVKLHPIRNVTRSSCLAHTSVMSGSVSTNSPFSHTR